MPASIGIDFGTNSVRALVVEVADGTELGSCVFAYPSGQDGILLDPGNHHLARQHPGDYLVGLEAAVTGALAEATRSPDFTADQVVGIGVDTTGSSPLPVDAHLQPLAMQDPWRGNLAAECWLWKDHTSHEEAARITELARQQRPEYLAKCGGTYSSEWFWSKLWRCLRTAPDVFDAAASWVELCDWIPAVLAGTEDPAAVQRGVCAAGHKAMYSDAWGGLPDKAFLQQLDPKLAELRERLEGPARDASAVAGRLCPAWAERLGLPTGIPIAIGELDVHYGAIGSGIAPGTLVKVIGTSTCDCAVVDAGQEVADIPGICGIVPGAILPGMIGIEAGQSAVGDIFKWWVEGICQGDADLHAQLTAEAGRLAPGQSGLLALDWNHGNRNVLADPMLSGLLVGQTLQTTRAEIYRALIEATAFGARTIIERLTEYGVPVDRVVCAGGIAEKNPLLMQLYADITGCTMRLAGSTQACALGAAISAAVVVGSYPDFPAAQGKMTRLQETVYRPRPQVRETYDALFALYRQLHDAFGSAFGSAHETATLTNVMKELLQIKKSAQRSE